MKVKRMKSLWKKKKKNKPLEKKKQVEVNEKLDT